jgi:hypothetical protein
MNILEKIIYYKKKENILSKKVKLNNKLNKNSIFKSTIIKNIKKKNYP